MKDFRRRDLLAAGAAGVGLATAGCTGSGDTDDSGGDGGDGGDGGSDGGDGGDTNPDGGDGGDGAADDGGDGEEAAVRPDLPALQYVRVENHHAESHSAHVLVENAEEIVHWSSHEVAAGDNVTLEKTWTAERGEFVVSIRIDDQTSWTQVDLTEEQPNCYGVAPRITEEGTVTVWWKSDPEGCGDAGGDTGSN